ncbi:MAG: MBL fold metallo-hydrolase, partial [Myxococcales bacterium]|nr:MBL fold metallo-hydrolase [Myxococcales bacterium]
RAREALLARAPGPTRALIFTHSHIDHIGGATAWAPLPAAGEESSAVPVWATAAFTEHFFKQYGVFQAAEQARGRRQFGSRVSERDLPCSALGARIDFQSGVGEGLRLPTDTFSGSTRLEVGGVTIELIEAHGETDDQLFVWLPDRGVLLAGDNYYHAFPNLYTIRGTRPRPVDAWISSIDRMRRLEPTLMIGSHTAPVVGEAEVAEVLRDYRDAIAFLRASVVRGANAGLSRAQIADAVTLPTHLADKPWLRELYGQLDWSALSIYDAELGWFDGRPETLYPLADAELARREVELMGGAAAVRQAAASSDDPRFTLHLLAKLRRSGVVVDAGEVELLDRAYAEALRAVAEGVANSNGRGYLLESALELEAGPAKSITPALSDEFLRSIPIELFFAAMPGRLKLELAGDVDETLKLELQDLGRAVWIRVRHGVTEIAWEQPFPGTPEPIATLRTDSLTWKRIALRLDTAGSAVTGGRLEVDGGLGAVAGFFDRFDRGI